MDGTIIMITEKMKNGMNDRIVITKRLCLFVRLIVSFWGVIFLGGCARTTGSYQHHPKSVLSADSSKAIVENENTPKPHYFLNYNYLTFIDEENFLRYAHVRPMKHWKKHLAKGISNDDVLLDFKIDYPMGSGKFYREVRNWMSEQIRDCIAFACFCVESSEYIAVVDADERNKEQLFSRYYSLMADSIKVRERRNKQAITDEDSKVSFNLCAMVTIGKVYESARYCTYYSDRFADASGAHGMPCRELATFDKQTGRLLKYDDIFDVKYHQELSEMLVDAWTKQKYMVDEYVEAMSDYVSGAFYCIGCGENEQQLMVNTNVGLLKDGVVFIYQPYELGCFAEGFFTFLMPYDKAKRYMKIKNY